tara:strand:+ start:217 stop:399 length:183 start_codon:yes stop_codon:yes gene_type:complete
MFLPYVELIGQLVAILNQKKGIYLPFAAIAAFCRKSGNCCIFSAINFRHINTRLFYFNFI